MSSLPRILKSIAVIDDGPESMLQTCDPIFQLSAPRGVIKGGCLSENSCPPPISTNVFAVAPKQTYMDEINRLKVEIEREKAELRSIRAEREAEFLAEEEAARVANIHQSDEADPTLANDEIYRARQEEINNMIQAAEQEINAMRAHSEEEAKQFMEQSKNEGYLEGFQKGYDEATAEFKKETQPQADLLAELVERMSNFEQQRLRDNEQELIAMVVAVASKVVSREIEENPESILDMLTKAVMRHHREEYVRINLAENLLPVDIKASDEIIKKLKSLGANITVRTSPVLPEGSIHLETPSGMEDMSVKTQMRNLEAMLSE